DGALPPILSKVHFKTRAPWIAILCIMIFSMFFVLFGDIKLVASITSLGVFITFALVNLSLMWLRYKKPELKRPFKVPINIGDFPIIAFLGLISCALMVTQFDLNAVLFGAFVLGMGVLIHLIYKKK
ncbi:amino acid permease, partial [Candidatus Bathyarchaeota archaeon]|nr:amino acid permease [Candidatus Bathyarchaeota archaeon]